MPIHHKHDEEMNQHSPADHMDEERQSNEDSSSTTFSLSPMEERERKQFTLDIHKFMAEIGKPLSKIPIMGYKELDLYQLFKEVTAHGGFNEVVKNVGTWSKIWKRLGNFDPSITDSSFRLKKNYERYLLEYEFKCFPEHRLQALDLSDKSAMKRSSSLNSLSTLSRPHSPINSISSSVHGSSIYSSSHASNTHFQSLHNSPEAFRKDKSKTKKKSLRKSARDIPSRSQSYNNLYTIPSLSSIKLPFILGDLTIENFGVIIPRYPYVVDGNIFPVGFTSHRYFASRINPEKQVKYTSQILDVNERPQFVVTAADDTEHPVISSESPSECWRIILQHFVSNDDESYSLSQTNFSDSSSNVSIGKLSVSGRMRFGLTHPEVNALIKELPNFDLIGPFSPSSKRKYTSISDDSADDSQLQRSSSKLRSSLIQSDDLDAAIATLQALKYCSVY